MTAFFPFVPSPTAQFQFQPTFDGDEYTVTVTWNLFGRRYYINVFTLAGDLIVSLPLIGSTTGFTIESLSWQRGKVEVVTAAPHGYDFAKTLRLTISGVQPNGYNGLVDALITSVLTFTYPLADFPGGVTQPAGVVSYDIDMMAGYFSSTLVFRTNQFEVNP